MELNSSSELLSVRTIDIERALQNLKDTLHKFQVKRRKSVQQRPSKLIVSDMQTNTLHENMKEELDALRGGFNVFAYIFQYPTAFKIPVKIPETLLFVSSHIYPVFLHNDPHGLITVDDSKYSTQHFNEKMATSTRDYPETLPKFIHISYKMPPTLCSFWEEAYTVFSECISSSHFLQRYIIPATKYASKIRYHWSIGKPHKSYIITNNEKREWKKKNPPIRTSKLPKICKNTLTVKPTGKNLPNNRRTSLAISRQIDNSLRNSDSLIVDYTEPSTCHLVLTYQKNPQLYYQLKLLIPPLSYSSLGPSLPLQDLILDFVKDPYKNWYLLGCKGYSLRGDKKSQCKSTEPLFFEPRILHESCLKYDIPKTSYPTNISEVLRSHVSKVIDRNSSVKTINSFMNKIAKDSDNSNSHVKPRLRGKHSMRTEQIDMYLQSKSSDHLGRIPVNMIKLNPGNSKNVLTNEIVNKREQKIPRVKHKEMLKDISWTGPGKFAPYKHVELTHKQLDDTAKLLHKRSKAAEEAKQEQKKKRELSDLLTQNPLIEKSLEKLALSLPTHPVLFRHFEHKSAVNLKIFAGKVYNCLNPETSLGSSLILKKLHQNMQITCDEFNEFLRFLHQTLLEDNFSIGDATCVTDNLYRFKDSIVTIKTY